MTYFYFYRSSAEALGTLPAGLVIDRCVTEQRPSKRDSLRELISRLEPGDLLAAESFAALADSSGDFLALMAQLIAVDASFISLQENVDTRTPQGSLLLEACSALIDIDKHLRRQKQRAGINRAKEEGKYKGRKPIAVDDTAFDAVAARWQAGEITARQAMAELDLKPNTFYRRIKERNMNMSNKEMKTAARAIKQEIREAAREEKDRAKALKEQVAAEAAAVKAEAGKKVEESVSLHQMERSIRHERRDAERAHDDSVDALKKQVAAERAAVKNS